MATSAKTTPRKTVAAKKTTPARKTAAKPVAKKVATRPTTRKTVSRKKPVEQEVTKEAVLHPVFGVAQVPPKSKLDGYINRKVWGQSDFDVFDAAFTTAMNILIEGPTGSGKTMSVEAWAAARGLNFASVSSNAGAEPSQLMGKYNPDETGEATFFWQDGLVTYIFRHGGVLLINEANFLPERIATVLFGPTDSRRALTLMDHNGELIPAHRPTVKKRIGGKMVDLPCWCDLPADECRSKWVLIVADMNPGYQGTRDLNDAFRNRFAIQLTFDYDQAVEKKLIASASLRTMAGDIRKSDEYETPCSTNMLVEFEALTESLGVVFAVNNFVNHFRAEERDACLLVVDTYKDNIIAELGGSDDADADEDSDSETDELVDDFDADDVIEVDDDTFDWVMTTK